MAKVTDILRAKSVLSVYLSAILAMGVAPADAAQPAASQAATGPKLTVEMPEPGACFIGRLVTEPSVKVTGPTGSPVADVTVKFKSEKSESCSGECALGLFPSGEEFVVRTNAEGIAVAAGFRPNHVPGEFAVIATATKAGFTEDLATRFHNCALDITSVKLVIDKGLSSTAHSTCDRIGRDIYVHVRDDQDRPVRWANVAFTPPQAPSGAGGAFTGGRTVAQARTDENGLAQAGRFLPNKTVGSYSIDVRASLGPGLASTDSIVQTNDKVGCGARAGPIVAVVVVGAGGAAAAAALRRRNGGGGGGGGATAIRTVTLTPGAPGIQPPR